MVPWSRPSWRHTFRWTTPQGSGSACEKSGKWKTEEKKKRKRKESWLHFVKFAEAFFFFCEVRMVSVLKGGMNDSGWQCVLDEAQRAACCIKKEGGGYRWHVWCVKTLISLSPLFLSFFSLAGSKSHCSFYGVVRTTLIKRKSALSISVGLFSHALGSSFLSLSQQWKYTCTSCNMYKVLNRKETRMMSLSECCLM